MLSDRTKNSGIKNTCHFSSANETYQVLNNVGIHNLPGPRKLMLQDNDA
jgi:hypothetical protein